MKFVADESPDSLIVSRLRQDGCDVLYVAEMTPGLPDSEVLDTANRNAAILLLADRDFGVLVFRRHLVSSGRPCSVGRAFSGAQSENRFIRH